MTSSVPASPQPPRVVLIEPRGGSNVGAVCRAIKNMGAGRLAVVRPQFDPEEARRMAVHAGDVLEGRLEVDTLAEAVSGCGCVIGTTARTGPWRERVEDVTVVAADISYAGLAGEPAAALVFGREDTGLHNEDIARCHRLATIPSTDTYASLNLAQAVLLVLWEVRRAGLSPAGLVAPGAQFDGQVSEVALARTPADGPGAEPSAAGAALHLPRQLGEPADAAQVEAMFEDLARSLVEIGFLSEREPGRVMASLRSLLSRARMERRELSILRGIARQISWFATGGADVVRRKRDEGKTLR